jgi:hypothetical protein
MTIAAEELTAGVVFRFGLRSEAELFYAEKRKPLVGDFDLGSNEEKEARITGFATLSVWDEELTAVAQAQQFISPERRLPIWLPVKGIRGLPHGLRVVRAPHVRELPGRDGHCDIGNVWSQTGRSSERSAPT